MDGRKILKGLVAVVMTAAAVVLVLISVAQVRMGLETGSAKLMLAMYLAMICYAAWRAFASIRDIFRKQR